MKLHFTATIKQRGINPFVAVSAGQAEQLQPGWRKAMPVIVQVNDQPKEPWHINMMPAGDGSFYLYLHGIVRKASATKVGDTVTIDVEFDDSYQSGPQTLPDWFSSALDKDKRAKANWQKLSPSRQKEVVRYLNALQSNDARQRNLERLLPALSGDVTHFMGRDWQDGK